MFSSSRQIHPNLSFCHMFYLHKLFLLVSYISHFKCHTYSLFNLFHTLYSKIAQNIILTYQTYSSISIVYYYLSLRTFLTLIRKVSVLSYTLCSLYEFLSCCIRLGLEVKETLRLLPRRLVRSYTLCSRSTWPRSRRHAFWL